MRRVMLDIETLGTQPGAVILSIGAVEFDAAGVHEEFYKNVDVQSCTDAGLTIDGDTFDWWMKQDEDAKHCLTGGVDLEDALRALARFVRGADEVWANSPTFDCRLLEAAFDAVGMETPWEYYEERDYRTLRELSLLPSIANKGTPHDAVDDARNQAKRVSRALADLEDDTGW